MNKKSFCLLFVVITIIGCSKTFSVMVKVLGLDVNSEFLELEFQFKDNTLETDYFVSTIDIRDKDSLLYSLVTETNGISKWNFPNLPEGFDITFPENETTIKNFTKNEELKFEFIGEADNSLAYSWWIYKPSYFEKQHRWMFDKAGNKKFNFECYYESWIGKDIVKIYSQPKLDIDLNSISLSDPDMNKIEFQIKTKNKINNVVFLTLNKDLSKDDLIVLKFKTNEGVLVSEEIVVERNHSIGIIGKYN